MLWLEIMERAVEECLCQLHCSHLPDLCFSLHSCEAKQCMIMNSSIVPLPIDFTFKFILPIFMPFFQVLPRPINVEIFLWRSQRNSIFYRASCSLSNAAAKEFLCSQIQNIQFIIWILYWALKWKYRSSLKRVSLLNPNKISNFLKKAVWWYTSFLGVIGLTYLFCWCMCMFFQCISWEH